MRCAREAVLQHHSRPASLGLPVGHVGATPAPPTAHAMTDRMELAYARRMAMLVTPITTANHKVSENIVRCTGYSTKQVFALELL